MFFLDSSGKLKRYVVNGWYNGLWPHYGRYGSWVMFNVNPLDDHVVVSDEALYMGDGKDYRWKIKWS